MSRLGVLIWDLGLCIFNRGAASWSAMMKRMFGFAGNRGVEKPSTPWKPLGGDTGGDCGNGLNEPMTVMTEVFVAAAGCYSSRSRS